MADFKDIEINLQRYTADIPPVVYVRLGTRIRFFVNGLRKFFPDYPYDKTSARIELYFDNPAGLGMQNVYSNRLSGLSSDSGILYEHVELAEGVAEKPGTYKYGFRVFTDGKRTYDEDPLIIVD